MNSQNTQGQPQTYKIIKPNEQDQQQKGWIVIKKKETPLTIQISDHSKVNKFYSHKSIQKYIRYLMTQTCPNPMWLSIKRQSQIQHIYYIDIQIQDYLFQSMLNEKNLEFISSVYNKDIKAQFRQNKYNDAVWQSLFIYDQEIKQNESLYKEFKQKTQTKIDQDLYKKYLSFILTPNQLRQNLYPNASLPLYSSYLSIDDKQNNQNQTKNLNQNKEDQKNQQKQEESFILSKKNERQFKNLILVIDCEMVTTQMGFELARCTIVNYEEEIIFDEYFKPKNQILNYNTQYSGITKQILDPISNTIQSDLHAFLKQNITKQTILVGHSLQNDFNAMKFIHNKVIDTSVLFKRKNGTKMKLKFLADKILKRKIQHGTHDSKEDCLATLHLLQLKIQMEDIIEENKEYHLLRDLIKYQKSMLIVDYDINNFRHYNSIHFQKVDRGSSPKLIFAILKKYSDCNAVSVPIVSFSRLQKNEQTDWQNYYSELDEQYRKLYEKVPTGSVFLLNFQVNQNIKILPFDSKQQINKTKSFCMIHVKN